MFMKLKTFILAICMAPAVFLFAQADKPAAQAPEKPKQARQMTPEERQMDIMRKVGGFVVKPSNLPGVLYLDLQDRLPHDFIAEKAKDIANSAKFKAMCESDKGDSQKAINKALERKKDVALVIAVVNEKGQPPVLLSPDQGWIKVNLDFLLSDNPDEARLKERMSRQMWRATGMIFGAGYSQQFATSVMQPVRKLADLDAITGHTYATDTVQTIFKTANQLKIANVRPTTYKRACEEGWAPMPTNEWQKAIWEATKAKKEDTPKE